MPHTRSWRTVSSYIIAARTTAVYSGAIRCRRVPRRLLQSLILHARAPVRQRLLRLCRLGLADEIVTTRISSGCPPTGGPGLDARVIVHLIHTLKAEVRALVDEEEDYDGAGQVAAGEYEPVCIPNVAYDTSCKKCLLKSSLSTRRRRGEWSTYEEEVPKPVARRAQCRLLGTCARREGLSDEDPNSWAPRHSITEDEQAGGDDHDVADRRVRGRVLRRPDRGKDEQPDRLPQATNNERPTTAKALHNVETTKCGHEVDGAEDELGDEGVGNTDGFENGGTVVD
jgi:hypothetical protein